MIERKNRFQISNQQFPNETALDQYVEWDALVFLD